jgi:hypothetical protein
MGAPIADITDITDIRHLGHHCDAAVMVLTDLR